MNRKVKVDKKPPNCRSCDTPLTRVHVTSYETYVWDPKTGHYRNDGGDAEERCPSCDHKYPCENKETGTVSCVDI